MVNPNLWFMHMGTPTTMKAYCRNQRNTETITINETGILQILQPCEATIGKTRLMFRRGLEATETKITHLQSETKIPVEPSWDETWFNERMAKQGSIEDGADQVIILINKNLNRSINVHKVCLRPVVY